MRLFTVFLLTALGSALFFDGVVNAEGLSPSCMSNRLYKAGIPHTKAVQYERNMLRTELTERKIIAIPFDTLRFLFQSDANDAQRIQDCIARRSDHCRKYQPCHNGGECQLNDPKKAYVCACHADFTGKFCRTPHPAPVGVLRELQRQFQTFKSSTEKRLKGRGSGCRLGYRYQSRTGPGRSGVGVLATMIYRKKEASSVLRLTYSTTTRIYGASAIRARWFFQIDGRECRKPSKIEIMMFNERGDEDFIPSVLFGICEDTDAGAIGKGDHTITVSVGPIEGYPTGNIHSGFTTTSIMEVQEMCPQF